MIIGRYIKVIRYGFNNPDKLWDEIILILSSWSSFVHGMSVFEKITSKRNIEKKSRKIV